MNAPSRNNARVKIDGINWVEYQDFIVTEHVVDVGKIGLCTVVNENFTRCEMNLSCEIAI